MAITERAPAGDAGLFGPGSATWRLHSDPLTGLAGLRALLLQALHPVAMRVVRENSRFREETWDRLAVTADYVGTTTFGSTSQALALGARVRAVHASIRGIDESTGLEYGADDEDLLLWVHCALVDSILDVVDRGRRLPAGVADRYVAEQVRSAALVGLEPDVVPASVADLAAYFEEVRPQLGVSYAAREAALYIVAPPMKPLVVLATPARPAWAGMAGLAFASLPAWARRLYALPELPGAAGLADAATTVALRSLRLALSGVGVAVPALRGESQRLVEARERLAAGAPAVGSQDEVVDLTAHDVPPQAAPASPTPPDLIPTGASS